MRAALLLSLAACGGVSSRLAQKPAPMTVAVLPVGGTADAGARELARALFTARLASLGFHVVENGYVDRVLSERGWLGDPEAFDPTALPATGLAPALGVDGVLLAKNLDSGGVNFLVFRRQSVSGDVQLVDKEGGDWWSASYTASQTGGLLLKSGQVISELRALGEHGTPMATVALLDEFVQDVAGTLPQQMPQGPPPGPGVPLVLGDAVVMREASPLPGCERILVAARSDAAAELTFDVGALRGVPMARDGTLFRGAADVPTGGPAAVTVNARSPYGEKRTMEAGR